MCVGVSWPAASPSLIWHILFGLKLGAVASGPIIPVQNPPHSEVSGAMGWRAL